MWGKCTAYIAGCNVSIALLLFREHPGNIHFDNSTTECNEYVCVCTELPLGKELDASAGGAGARVETQVGLKVVRVCDEGFVCMLLMPLTTSQHMKSDQRLLFKLATGKPINLVLPIFCSTLSDAYVETCY